jgi:F-type H+-transporting ATPase subunit a
MRKFFLFLVSFILFTAVYHTIDLYAGNSGGTNKEEEEHNKAENTKHGDNKFDAGSMILHHVADANEFEIGGDFAIPLPIIIYDNRGFHFMLSSKFKHGHKAIDGYVLDHGVLKKINGPFPEGETEVYWTHDQDGNAVVNLNAENEHHTSWFQQFKNDLTPDDEKYGEISIDDFNFKVSRSGFFDLSITKTVFGIIFSAFLMILIFSSVARGYKKRIGKAPKGIQSFFEPLIVFVRDEIAIPNIGPRYEKYLPYLLTVFFFIWINNMLGLVPIFPGSANVTGNIIVTMTLALFTFFIVQLSANKAYWKHIFWMPGVPVPVRIMLAPIELIGIFTKPFALMVRLFANITAGHIVILSFVSLIFMFGNAGENIPGGVTGSVLAVPFMLFMNVLELLVAFLQAFIFTILSALFIGQAIEEHH